MMTPFVEGWSITPAGRPRPRALPPAQTAAELYDGELVSSPMPDYPVFETSAQPGDSPMARIAATAPESQVDLDEKYDLVAVETAIKKIEAAYRLGLKSIEQHGGSLHSKPSGIIPAFATDKGYRRDAVEQARHFARVFTPEDMREICRECRKHNFPLGVTLIYRALPLGDPDECMKLLRRAIRGRWTQRRMVAKVHACTGAKTRRGRARALPEK